MARGCIIALALLLAGCAHHDPKPEVCDGKHRRPANPYGSVLPNIPGATALPAPAAPPSPAPQSKVDPKPFMPCGDGT